MKHRGIQLKASLHDDEGLVRLLHSAGVEVDLGAGPDPEGEVHREPALQQHGAASRSQIARQLREELDDTLLLLDQALSAVGVDRPVLPAGLAAGDESA